MKVIVTAWNLILNKFLVPWLDVSPVIGKLF